MVRRKKLRTPSKADSRLQKLLKEGKSIRRLVGYVNIASEDDNPVYAKVACVGFASSVDDDCSCSRTIKIKGQVLGTGSIVTFTPCNWLDSLSEVEKDCDLNRRKTEARFQYKKIINHHYLTRRRLSLFSFILDSLSKEDQKAIYADMAERGIDKNKLSDSEVKDYARTAALVANGIPKDEADHWYD